MEVIVVALHRDGVAEVDAGLAGHGALGGNDHGTVAALGAVQRGGGRALEDVDALDVVHVDGILVGDRTVHDEDRLRTAAVIVAGSTAEHDGTGIEGRAGGGEEAGAGDLAGQGLAEVGLTGHRQVFTFDLDRGVADGLLLTGEALGGHDDLLEGLGIRLDGHVDGAAAADGDDLGHVTHGAEHERPVGGSAEGIITVHVGDGAEGGTPHLHGSKGCTLSRCGIGNLTCDSDILCGQGRRDQNEQSAEEQFRFFHKHRFN